MGETDVIVTRISEMDLGGVPLGRPTLQLVDTGKMYEVGSLFEVSIEDGTSHEVQRTVRVPADSLSWVLLPRPLELCLKI